MVPKQWPTTVVGAAATRRRTLLRTIVIIIIIGMFPFDQRIYYPPTVCRPGDLQTKADKQRKEIIVSLLDHIRSANLTQHMSPDHSIQHLPSPIPAR